MLEIFIRYVVPLIITIEVIIFIHSFGHFLGCKLLSVKLKTVSFGFGPKLLGYFTETTVWKICFLPVGGYIRPDYESYRSGNCGKYIAVALSGIISSLVISFLLLTFIFILKGFPVVQDGTLHLSRLSFADSFLTAFQIIIKSWITWQMKTWSVIASSYHESWSRMAFFIAILASQLAIINILPIPGFDGWNVTKIVMIFKFGKAKAEKVMGKISKVIISLIVLILCISIYNDLVHLKVISYLRGLFS